MHWSDVMAPPPRRQLRQFAGLFLVVFAGLGGWRWYQGQPDAWAVGLLSAALVIGAAGLVFPPLVRPVYTGWMIAAFPIGWTVSRAVLAAVFFLVVTPVGIAFRLFRRDPLWLRRRNGRTFWTPKHQPATMREYFRQT